MMKESNWLQQYLDEMANSPTPPVNNMVAGPKRVRVSWRRVTDLDGSKWSSDRGVTWHEGRELKLPYLRLDDGQ